MAVNPDAYERMGELIWIRLKMLGVDDPRSATLAFFEARPWVSDRGDGLIERLLVETTTVGLQGRKHPPSEDACAALGTGGAVVERLLEGPAELHAGLVYHYVDDIPVDAAASLGGCDVDALQAAVDGMAVDVRRLAPAIPDDTPDDGHLTTLDQYAMVVEDAEVPFDSSAVNDHLQFCPMCTARTEAWNALRTQFRSLPGPPAPPPPSNVGPLALAGAGAVALALALAVVAGFLYQAGVIGPRVWDGSEAGVILKSADTEFHDGDAVARDTVLQVWADPRGAPHLAIAQGHDGRFDEVLLVQAVEEPWSGSQLGPVDLVVTGKGDPTVWVVSSATPLDDRSVREVAAGQRPGAVNVVQLDLK